MSDVIIAAIITATGAVLAAIIALIGFFIKRSDSGLKEKSGAKISRKLLKQMKRPKSFDELHHWAKMHDDLLGIDRKEGVRK